MMIRTFIFCLFTGSFCHGQIVNIEQLRLENKNSGLYGSLSANVNIQRNTRNLLNLKLGGHLNKVYDKNQLILKGELGFAQSGNIDRTIEDDIDFSNDGFLHLRYTQAVDTSRTVSWEYFTQIQYNKLTRIDSRLLVGSGPRFQLTKFDNALFHWGLILMYEREQIFEEDILNSDVRVSSYFSFNLKPQSTVSFVSTTYVQPRIMSWSDYRLLTDNILQLGITDKLELQISIRLTYDREPPTGLPNLIYNMFNGLRYKFQPKKVKPVKKSPLVF